MKILVVSQYFWPENFRINEVVESLVKKGLTVDVLTGKPNYPEGKFFQGYCGWDFKVEHRYGATIYRIPMIERGKHSGVFLALNYLSFVISGLVFSPWILRRRHYDCILVYGMSPILQAIPALFLSWIKRVKLSLWVQDLWPESLEATGYVRNRLIHKMVERIVRFIYHHSDQILVQSEAFKSRISAFVPGKEVIYYPNSAELVFGNSTHIPVPQINGLETGFSVLFAGNVGAAQAVEVMIEAAALLRKHTDINLVVLGQGSRWNWMKEQVEQLKLTNLHLPGRFPLDTMPTLMRKASALLVSLTDRPIFAATIPSKVQAYMAAGRPILACLNGEGARIVNEAEAGVTVPAEDGRRLAAAILRLYRMPAKKRALLGINARKYYEANFDHEKLMNQLTELLCSLSKANCED